MYVYREEAVAEDGACTLKTRKRKREHENDSRWEDIQANYSEVVVGGFS